MKKLAPLLAVAVVAAAPAPAVAKELRPLSMASAKRVANKRLSQVGINEGAVSWHLTGCYREDPYRVTCGTSMFFFGELDNYRCTASLHLVGVPSGVWYRGSRVRCS